MQNNEQREERRGSYLQLFFRRRRSRTPRQLFFATTMASVLLHEALLDVARNNIHERTRYFFRDLFQYRAIHIAEELTNVNFLLLRVIEFSDTQVVFEVANTRVGNVWSLRTRMEHLECLFCKPQSTSFTGYRLKDMKQRTHRPSLSIRPPVVAQIKRYG